MSAMFRKPSRMRGQSSTDRQGSGHGTKTGYQTASLPDLLRSLPRILDIIDGDSGASCRLEYDCLPAHHQIEAIEDTPHCRQRNDDCPVTIRVNEVSVLHDHALEC